MPILVCPFCGTDNPPSRTFCRKCASDLRSPVREPVAATAPERATVPIKPIVIGGGLALVAVVILLGLVVVLGGTPAASPSYSPSSIPTLAPSAALTPTEAPIVTAAPTPAETPVETPVETPAGTLEPGASQTPSVDSLSGPRRASCTEANGSAPAGYIHLSWEAVGTTGVRLSIDPPAPNTAYDYGYEDYPAVSEADVPFTCGPPTSDANGDYHLYVVTTIHDRGYFAYRYIKVYVRT